MHSSTHTQLGHIKDVKELKDTVKQLDLIDIYRTLHPTTAEKIFFSSAIRIFTRINHMLAINKAQQLKSIEIIQSMFSDQNGI